MAQTHFLPVPNKDLITSIVFNYYGKRIAVSSLDEHIYVISSDPDTGRWPDDLPDASCPPPKLASAASRTVPPSVQSWAAHEGPVVKVVWSDPVHGEMLASAGTDGTVRIWEEDASQLEPVILPAPAGLSSTRPSKQPPASVPCSWRAQTVLTHATGTVRDIAFSPSETSLRLASIATDDHLRLYECLDTSAPGADDWNMIVNIDLSVLPLHACSFASHLNPLASAAGVSQQSAYTSTRGFDPASSLTSRKNTPPASFNLLNPSSGLRSSAMHTQLSVSSSTGSSAGQAESAGGWALSWCPETYWGDILSVASGSAGVVRLFKFASHSQWDNFEVINPLSFRSAAVDSIHLLSPSLFAQPPVAAAPIASLAWAPRCGRDHHLIAAGYRDGRVRIWKLTPPGLGPARGLATDWDTELEAELDNHVPKGAALDSSDGAGVTKCEWNVTGTVMSTSGSDGKVRLWKMGYSSRWTHTAQINFIGQADKSNELGPKSR